MLDSLEFYDAELQRLQIRHIDIGDRAACEIKNELGLHDKYDSNSSYCMTACHVLWGLRTLVSSEPLDTGFMVHEIVHTLYTEPPLGMDPESHTWMYAAEHYLARRWDILYEWLDYQDDTPIDIVEGYGQIQWKYMSYTQRKDAMNYWRYRLREEGLMRNNHLTPIPVWLGQTVPERCGYFRLRNEVLYDINNNVYVHKKDEHAQEET